MGQKIDKEVFDKFFKESYCTVEYETVKEEFERIASIGNDLFTGSYEARNLNRENFILYLTSDSYCDFEAAVQEAMDDLNPEILDAVMDVTVTTMKGEATPYVRFGDWPAVIFAILMILGAFIGAFAEKRFQKD